MVVVTNHSQTQIDINTKKVIPWLNNKTADKALHGIDDTQIQQ